MPAHSLPFDLDQAIQFAISKVDEEEAAKVFSYLQEMGELEL